MSFGRFFFLVCLFEVCDNLSPAKNNTVLNATLIKVENSKNKRGLSCAKLSQQIIRFLGPMELFFRFELLMVEVLNC